MPKNSKQLNNFIVMISDSRNGFTLFIVDNKHSDLITACYQPNITNTIMIFKTREIVFN